MCLGQGRSFALINIEARYSQLLLRKQQGEGQAEIAETNNGDSCLSAFGFQLRNSIGGSDGRSCYLRYGIHFRIGMLVRPQIAMNEQDYIPSRMTIVCAW